MENNKRKLENLHIIRKVAESMEFIRQYISYAEKPMANHSSTPTWKIPWMEESGRLQSMGSRRVEHD